VKSAAEETTYGLPNVSKGAKYKGGLKGARGYGGEGIGNQKEK